MKARLLKQLCNNINYIYNNNHEYIAVGSSLCHNLISVNKETLKVKYALDTFHEGRESLKNDDLIFIWDKLHELIRTGQIQDIINGTDEIENPLPVFTVEKGQLIETFTDKYGWPNVTIDGHEMYDNTYFKTKKKAIEYGIKDSEAGIKNMEEHMSQQWDDLIKTSNRILREKEYLKHFNSLK